MIKNHPIRGSMRTYFLFVRYLASSLLTTGVDYLIFALCYSLTHKISISIFAARVAALAVQFALLRFAVFIYHQSFWISFAKYIVVVAVSGVLTSIMIYNLKAQLGVPVLFGKIIAELLLYFLNFIILKWLVFKPSLNDKANVSP